MPPRGDRLALALWWLIESIADEFGMPPERAADEVAMRAGKGVLLCSRGQSS
jgi:hypothetical protein